MVKKKHKKSLAQLRTRLQNRTAFIILLLGALCGSFFVDVTQMVRGAGFTDRAVQTTSVIPYEGRTWVAYKEPIVPLIVIADLACEDCQLDALVAWLQYTVPTVRVDVIDYRTVQGQALMERHDLVQIPSVLFDAAITQTNFFAGTQQLFTPHAGFYIFNLPVLDIIPVHYMSAPHAEHAVTQGSETDITTVTLLGNFACSACAEAHAKIVKERALYTNAKKPVRYAFVAAPMNADDARGERAIEAAYCATAQDVSAPYISQLFALQRLWRRSSGDVLFVRAARNAHVPDMPAFEVCLSEGRFSAQRAQMMQEAARFGTPELPLVFVGDTLVEDMSLFADTLAEVVMNQSVEEPDAFMSVE